MAFGEPTPRILTSGPNPIVDARLEQIMGSQLRLVSSQEGLESEQTSNTQAITRLLEQQARLLEQQGGALREEMKQEFEAATKNLANTSASMVVESNRRLAEQDQKSLDFAKALLESQEQIDLRNLNRSESLMEQIEARVGMLREDADVAFLMASAHIDNLSVDICRAIATQSAEMKYIALSQSQMIEESKQAIIDEQRDLDRELRKDIWKVLWSAGWRWFKSLWRKRGG